MTHGPKLLTAAALAALLSAAGPATAELRVHSYSSPDPDSVNTLADETAEGLVVISAQRTLSEAEHAVARLKRTGHSVAAIVIPVPHTDHFGGLTVFRTAFPDAPVYASEATIRSLRTDGEGYNASRKKALGADFPSQDQVIVTLPDVVLKDGDQLDFGYVRLFVIEVANANAPSNTLLYVEDEGVLFGVEVVEDGVTAFLKDADLDGWIAVLDNLLLRLPGIKIVYGAHNAPAPADYAFRQQRTHLLAYRNALAAVLEDDEMSHGERSESVAAIQAAFPDHAQVARVPRDVFIGLNLDWHSAKRSSGL